MMEGEILSQVVKFKYLGSIFQSGKLDEDFTRRVGVAVK